jgi:hypothetical protein
VHQLRKVCGGVLCGPIPTSSTWSASNHTELEPSQIDVVSSRGQIPKRIRPLASVKLFLVWQGTLDETDAPDAAPREWRQVGEERNHRFDVRVEVKGIMAVE